MMGRKGYLFIAFIVMFIFLQHAVAEVRFKTPKLDVSLSSGYDSNILRVSQFADSNRVSGVTQMLNAKAIEWIYWGRNVKSYISFSGKYNWFSANYPENTGNGYIRFKTFADILAVKTGNWVPGIRWDFELRGAILDRYYSNRSLGEEFTTLIDRISGRTLPLGDLFDRKYVRLATGLRFMFDQRALVEIEYYRQLNNFTDIGDPATEDFYSLDNVQNKLQTRLTVFPINWLSVNLGYEWSTRLYDHKFARDIGGNLIPDLNRKYIYNDFDLQLIAGFENINGYIRYLRRLRSDDRDGYYGYQAKKISLGVSYRFMPDWQLFVDYDSSRKIYDYITLGGEILDNSYLDFETSVVYQISPQFSFAVVYVYEDEDSSYDKFSYKRHISFMTLQYDIF